MEAEFSVKLPRIDVMAIRGRLLEEWLLRLAAVFPIFWAVIRARVQSITMDEANSYFGFVARSDLWYPFPNNHILNSLLMWLSTNTFGTSAVTIRSPALLGGTLYVAVCYFLCRRIVETVSIQLLIFVGLVYNPLILDYMVAARGYSLATAFLLGAIALPVWCGDGRTSRSVYRVCVLASLALGLSFAANFSFAFADLAAFVFITTWAVTRKQGKPFPKIVACGAPGLCVALLICGYPLAHWNRADLTWGVQSLKQTRQNLVQSSFYRLDPRFRTSLWYRVMDSLRPRLPPLLLMLCLGRIAVMATDRSWLRDRRIRYLGVCAAALAGIITVCVLIHWLAFRIDGLPLPVGRTGIFLLPLTTLLGATIMAMPTSSAVSRWLRVGILTVFTGIACYFLLCLRISYFKEYQFDADAKEAYSLLARYNHTYGVKDVGMTGLCFASMNYYRVMSGKETFSEFRLEQPDPPPGKSVYVMSGVDQRNFIAKEKLVVVYRGKLSDLVIAVRPNAPIPPIPLGI